MYLEIKKGRGYRPERVNIMAYYEQVIVKCSYGEEIKKNPVYTETKEGLFEMNGRLYYEDTEKRHSYTDNSTQLKLKTAGGLELDVIPVNYGTKAADELKYRYSSIEGYTVKDVYSRPSKYKIEIDDSLQDLCNRMGGRGYGITGHNGYYFSSRWYLEAAGADGIEQEWLIVETASGRKATPLDHDDRITKRRKGQCITVKTFIDYIEEMNKNKEEMWREINEDLYAEIYPY